MKARLPFMLAAVLAVPLFMIGCDAGVSGVPEAKTTYSGEAIFRGLILGQGAVADVFPEVWVTKKEALRANLGMEEATAYLEALHAYGDGVVDAIYAEDAPFFERFGRAISSGDHVAVEAALVEAQAQLVFGTARVAQMEPTALAGQLAKAGEPGETSAYAQGEGLIILAPILIDIDTQVNMWPGPWLYEFISRPEKAEKGLGRDQYVDMIATRL